MCFPLQDVIQKLHMKEPLLRPLMNDMEIKATGMLKSCGATGPPGTVKSQKPLTEFQPFNLTAVKPRPQKREKGTTQHTEGRFRDFIRTTAVSASGTGFCCLKVTRVVFSFHSFVWKPCEAYPGAGAQH